MQRSHLWAIWTLKICSSNSRSIMAHYGYMKWIPNHYRCHYAFLIMYSRT